MKGRKRWKEDGMKGKAVKPPTVGSGNARTRRGIPARNETQRPPSELRAGAGGKARNPSPPKEGGKGKKRRRAPTTAAVALTCPPGEYRAL